jgi:hypothetical protein
MTLGSPGPGEFEESRENRDEGDMHLEFDIDEFLAYLLPGALVVILAHSIFGIDAAQNLLDLKLPQPDYTTGMLCLFAYLGISLAAGHVASIWSRAVLQPLVRSIAGDPQTAIFGGSDRFFYTADFRKLVHDKFQHLYKSAIDAPGMREAAPQMIRAHVLKNSSAAITVRERVVRARSLCGNLTFPLVLFAVPLACRGDWLHTLLPLLIAGLLAAKQHLLDQREYRAINSYFIAA